MNIKVNSLVSTAFSSESCPTCVGLHSTDCLPNSATIDSCPHGAFKCHSSTLKFQSGEKREIIKCLFYARRSLVPSHYGERLVGSRERTGVAATRRINSKAEGEGCLVSKSLVGEPVIWSARGVWKEGQGA